MQSESARMSTAAEARFRVPTAATSGRVVHVVALEPKMDAVVARLSSTAGASTRAFSSASVPTAGATDEHLDAITAADLVVMVAAEGGRADAASAIGEACSRKRVMTTALVLHADRVDDAALSKTLAQVRPWALMVVVTSDHAYLEDILGAFR
ncbi:MAG: hypothetical protein AB7I50_01300 [Vicinamibacterales bacterium]